MKVLLGMSGGVDSSVAALLLKRQGYEVVGAFMKNFSDTKNKLTGECAWIEERAMAQKIASMLKIPFITIDSEKLYKTKVIDQMYNDYTHGLTPNPDSLCNAVIKFPILLAEAKKLGIPLIATGHYIRIKQSKTKQAYELLRGKDESKDQSYFLYDLTQAQLKHILFPIGNYTKSEVRQIAKQHKFPNADKPGTRGICFVGKTNMKEFLRKKIKSKPGKILDPEGRVVGTHPGVAFYTIGERVGPHIDLNITQRLTNKKYYIASKNQHNNTLTIAPKGNALLLRKEFYIKKINLISPIKQNSNVLVRIRHLGKLIPAKIKKISSTKLKCTLKTPLESIAPGQSAVLYAKTQVLGGGEITL